MYAIVALGYTMVYGILVLINFAHGEVVMVGAYTGVAAMAALTWGGQVESLGFLPCTAAAMLASMAVSALYGFSIERVAYRPLRHAPALSPLISAVGVSIFLQNFVQLSRGSAPVYMPMNGPEYREVFYRETPWRIAGADVRPLDVLILVVCIALCVALWFFVQRTRLGKAMRATSQDKTMAGLIGISVDRVISITFMIGSMLAAVAGVLLTLYNEGQASTEMGFKAGMSAFTAAVLGGIGNLPGAMLGGVLLGLAEATGIHFFGANHKAVYTFVILLAVLVVRPRGIMGERVAEKV
jgi:branched-chain amino acid transport system permease protein